MKLHREKHFDIAFHFQKYDLTILRFTQVSLDNLIVVRIYILTGWPSPALQKVEAFCLGGGIAGPYNGILLHR